MWTDRKTHTQYNKNKNQKLFSTRVGVCRRYVVNNVRVDGIIDSADTYIRGKYQFTQMINNAVKIKII